MLELDKSFINSKKNNGTKIESWRTTETIVFITDLVFYPERTVFCLNERLY